MFSYVYTSYFNFFTVQMSEKRDSSIDIKNEWLLLSVRFTAKLELVFVLALQNAFFLEFSFLKPTERA